MTDRTVKVSLQAQVSNYLANMDKAARATVKVTDTLEKQKAASIAAAKAQGEAAEKIGAGLVAVGALAAVSVALAVKKFAEFDEAISNVKAATQESAENMALLRDAALDAGASTVFSATEAAHAIEELGKNGLTTAQILEGGLSGALSLASAGQLDVARAAEIAAISMKQFGLEGGAIPHIADLLAAGAGKAAGDVEDLAQALNQSALVANDAGLTIEDTTGVLSAFADAGLVGSDAGTSFKSMLQKLTPVSKESKDAMDELGISAYNAQGDFIGIEGFAGNLQEKLKDLTVEQRNAALAQIFGSDAVRAASRLYDLGSEGISRYIDQTNDSGYAAKVAADRLNNLNGDIEKLGGAFDTYLIKSGSGANDTLRTLVQGATGLVDAVGSLPEPVLGAALGVGGLVAAVALAGGATLIAIPKIAAFKASLTGLGISGGAAARGVGLMSGGLALAGVAFAIFAERQANATARTQEFKDSLDPTTGALTDYTRELVAKKLAESGAFEVGKKAGITQRELTDAVINGGKELDKVKGKLGGINTIATAFDGTAFAAGNASNTVTDLNANLEQSKDNLKDEAAAADESSKGTDNAAAAYQIAADKAAELQTNLLGLIDTINAANGVGQDAVSSNIAYQDALAGVDEQIKNIAEGVEGFAGGLDLATDAGRDNLGMLNDLAAKGQDAAKAQFDLDGNTEAYRVTLEAGRQAVIDRATALGATAEEAQILADKIAAIPTEAQFKVIADTVRAQEVIDGFVTTNDGRTVAIRAIASYERNFSGGGFTGSGGKYEPAGVVHRSEFVSTAETTANPDNRRALEYMHRGGVIRGYADGGYVSGRDVQYVQSGGSMGGASAGRGAVNSSVSVTMLGSDAHEVASVVSNKQNWEWRRRE